MFTGIIEEKGKIQKIVKGTMQNIEIKSRLENKIGDSISVQGICLTVTAISKKGFSIQAMKQTEHITTLPDWRAGDLVNLERALKIGDRLGGHIMLGHIDQVARVIRVKGNRFYFKIRPEKNIYLIPKGSIGIDGVSLTISDISRDTISVNITPFTLSHTSLDRLKTGTPVNVEFDYLAKFFMPGQQT